MHSSSQEFMDSILNRNGNEPEFIQAVQEVVESIWDYLQDNPQYIYLLSAHLAQLPVRPFLRIRPQKKFPKRALIESGS